LEQVFAEVYAYIEWAAAKSESSEDASDPA
jgi:hypothetical protein